LGNSASGSTDERNVLPLRRTVVACDELQEEEIHSLVSRSFNAVCQLQSSNEIW